MRIWSGRFSAQGLGTVPMGFVPIGTPRTGPYKTIARFQFLEMNAFLLHIRKELFCRAWASPVCLLWILAQHSELTLRKAREGIWGSSLIKNPISGPQSPQEWTPGLKLWGGNAEYTNPSPSLCLRGEGLCGERKSHIYVCFAETHLHLKELDAEQTASLGTLFSDFLSVPLSLPRSDIIAASLGQHILKTQPDRLRHAGCVCGGGE